MGWESGTAPLASLLRFSQGYNQGVSRTLFTFDGLTGQEFISGSFWLLRSFPCDLWLRALPVCWLLAGGCPQALQDAHSPRPYSFLHGEVIGRHLLLQGQKKNLSPSLFLSLSLSSSLIWCDQENEIPLSPPKRENEIPITFAIFCWLKANYRFHLYSRKGDYVRASNIGGLFSMLLPH